MISSTGVPFYERSPPTKDSPHRAEVPRRDGIVYSKALSRRSVILAGCDPTSVPLRVHMVVRSTTGEISRSGSSHRLAILSQMVSCEK